MANCKHQNSFLVLATIGVYFGLVFAGAAPQVLAQAAMAKQFDSKDEINKTDGLEEKPDDGRSPVPASVQIYLKDVEYFLSSLSLLAAQGKFDPKKDVFNVAQTTLLPCVANNLAGRYTPIRFDSSSSHARPPLTYFSRGMVYGYSLGDCVENPEFKTVEAVDSRFDFILNDKGFAVNVGVKKQSPERAQDLFVSLNSTLKLFSQRDNTTLRQRIIDQTRFTFQNDQVFIRLHLARAGLDSLLATSAK